MASEEFENPWRRIVALAESMCANSGVDGEQAAQLLSNAIQAIIPMEHRAMSATRNNISNHALAAEATTTNGNFYTNNHLNNASSSNAANYAIDGGSAAAAGIVSGHGNRSNTTVQTNTAGSTGNFNLRDSRSTNATCSSCAQTLAALQREYATAQTRGAVYMSNSLNSAANFANSAIIGSRHGNVTARETNAAVTTVPVCWRDRYNTTTVTATATRRHVDQVFAPRQYESEAQVRPAGFVYASNASNNAQNIARVAVHQGSSCNVINQSTQYGSETAVSAGSAHAHPQYTFGVAGTAGFVYRNNPTSNAQNVANYATDGFAGLATPLANSRNVSSIQPDIVSSNRLNVAGSAGTYNWRDRYHSAATCSCADQTLASGLGHTSIGTNNACHHWTAPTHNVNVQTDASSINGNEAAISAGSINWNSTPQYEPPPNIRYLNNSFNTTPNAAGDLVVDHVPSRINTANSETAESTETVCWRNNNVTGSQSNFRAEASSGRPVPMRGYFNSSATNLQFGTSAGTDNGIMLANSSATSSQHRSASFVNWRSHTRGATLTTPIQLDSVAARSTTNSVHSNNNFFNIAPNTAEHVVGVTAGVANPVNTSNSLSEYNANISSQHYSEVESTDEQLNWRDYSNMSATSLQRSSSAAATTRRLAYSRQNNNAATFTQSNFGEVSAETEPNNWRNFDNSNVTFSQNYANNSALSAQYASRAAAVLTGSVNNGSNNNNVAYSQNSIEAIWRGSSNPNITTLQYNSRTAASTDEDSENGSYYNNSARSPHNGSADTGSTTGPIRTSLQYTSGNRGSTDSLNWRQSVINNLQDIYESDSELTELVDFRNSGASPVHHEADSRELLGHIYWRDNNNNVNDITNNNNNNSDRAHVRFCINNHVNIANARGFSHVAGNNIQVQLRTGVTAGDHIATRPVARSYNSLIQIIPSQTAPMQTVRDESRIEISASVSSEMQTNDSEKISNESSSNTEASYKCSICFEAVQDRNPTCTECGHIFCRTCITRALRLYRKCPLCNAETDLSELRRLYMI